MAAGRAGAGGSEGSEDLVAWFAARLPDEWQSGPPTVEADGEEIVVTVQLASAPDGSTQAFGDGDRARIEWFRAQTRDERMALASVAEAHFGRRVSWGACSGDQEATFTTVAVPVMTRLRLSERAVLDTLIDAGVARSRSEALAWCVRLVADNEEVWIVRLRQAFAAVAQARASGPASRPPGGRAG